MPHEIYIVLRCAVPSRWRAEVRPSRVGAEAKEADAGRDVQRCTEMSSSLGGLRFAHDKHGRLWSRCERRWLVCRPGQKAEGMEGGRGLRIDIPTSLCKYT